MAFKLWRLENTDRTVPKKGTMSLAQKMGDEWLIFRSLQSSTHCNGFLTYLSTSAIALGVTTWWSPWSFKNKTSVITLIFSRWYRGHHSSQSMILGLSLFLVGYRTGPLQFPDLLCFPSLCRIQHLLLQGSWGLPLGLALPALRISLLSLSLFFWEFFLSRVFNKPFLILHWYPQSHSLPYSCSTLPSTLPPHTPQKG